MSPQLIGVTAILSLVVLVFLRVPVAAALLGVGLVGYAAIDGWRVALITFGTTPFNLAQAYSLSVVPLFLLMGVVAARTAMAQELFAAANALFAGRKGGLAMATVGACAGFGAICGSSLATASTMTRVSVPEMRRYGYADDVASGVVASGGTLGILIPPSIILVIYAIIAQESVPALFAAALFPGLVMIGLHILVIAVMARMRPAALPTAPGLPAVARLQALLQMWKMALIFGVVIGGIYLGWFSPTEAAAIGAFLTIVIGFASRQMNLKGFAGALRETVTTTGSLFFIVLGAFVFAYFVVQTRIPATLGDWVVGLGLSPLVIILFFVLVYLVLGCFLDSISMMLITIPVFLPIAQDIGYSAVWFGIFIVIVAEIGLITPPVGLNIFVIRAQQPDIALTQIYKGIAPFLIAHLLGVAALIAFPALALWLPGILY
jgi:C4-dicarboxylate transporter DctM subunit